LKLNWLEFAAMNNPVRAWLQHHIEARRLLKMGGPAPNARALEIGCGRGVGSKLILDVFHAATVDAFDLDPRMIKRAAKRLKNRGGRVRLWVGDATQINAPDSTYDAVFDFGIIHHIPDWRKALAEVHRVLKPRGRFYAEEILKDFIRHPLWRRLLDHPIQDRFDHQQFIDALNQAGLTVTADKPFRQSIGWYVAEKNA
jgi:ubiquinone/menaquinone biosynthesis C-methylase UbiE